MKKILSIFLFILFMNGIQASEYTKLNFDSLKSMDNSEIKKIPIEIRGFIYSTNEGQMILSSKPNLKTCCIGAPDKISEQILIDIKNKLPETNGVVTLRGELEINVIPFENKLATFPYLLTNAELVANDSDTCSILLLSIICLCIIICATKFRTFFTSFFRF